MKKLIVIILSAFCLSALFTWFSCNPFNNHRLNSDSESAILDELDGTRLTISCPIDVNGSTWDGAGESVATNLAFSDWAENSSDGSDAPIFRLTNGTVKNCSILPPAFDGVWIYGGNATLDNVTVPDTGEDVVTVKKPGTYTVSNCIFKKSEDKMIQVVDLCTITVQGVNADTAQKFLRQNGGKTWKMTAYCNGCTVMNMSECIFRSDSPSSTFFYRNLTTNCATIGYTGTAVAVY